MLNFSDKLLKVDFLVLGTLKKIQDAFNFSYLYLAPIYLFLDHLNI
jgi:DNA polymerase III alpha subunit